MKIDDVVPTMMPNTMVIAKNCTEPRPMIASGRIDSSTVSEVATVRDSVWLIDTSIT